MKYVFALLLLAGLALAEPESTPDADAAADAWYGYYGHGLGYRRYYGGYYGGYYGRGYGYGYGYYGRKKREADPAVLATTHSAPAVAPLVHPYGYALGYGYGLHHAPTVGYTVEHKATEHIPGAVTAVAGEPTVVHVAGYGLGYGLWGRKKREADPAVVAVKHAAPTAVIPPPVPLARGENFLAPAAPHLHTVEHKGTEIIPGAVAAGTTPVAYAAPYGYGYGYGYGLHHPLLVAAPAAAEEAAVTDARKKREADPEAEADPAVLYSGYYGHPYAYGYGLGGYYGGYGGYAGRGYYGYGLGGLGYAYYG